MIAYQVDIDLIAKVLVRAENEASARRQWEELSGTSIDLGDKRWWETGHTAPFAILGEMRFAAVRRPAGSLRPVSKKRLYDCIEGHRISDDRLAPRQTDSRTKAKGYPLTVLFNGTMFIEKELRYCLAEMIEEPPHIPVDLKDASAHWLTMLGFNSDNYPMVIVRTVAIGSLSNRMIKPGRDRCTGEIVEKHRWASYLVP